MPHYLQFDSYMMNPSRIRRCMVESEEFGSKNTEEKELSGNFAGLQKFATCKFRRLPIFATCEHCSPVCLLTSFLPTFWWFYTSFPSCNFGFLAHFCNFLILRTYISSVLLVIKSTFWHSINQSRKFGTKLPLPLLLVIFSSSPFTFLHFLGSQTPLDDDKSRDAWLKSPNP